MLEPSGAVPQIGGSAPTTVACSPLECLTDQFASMAEVSEHQGVMDLACFSLFDAHQGNPGGPRTGVEFQGNVLHRALGAGAIGEPNDKRCSPMHHRSLAREQESCPLLRARHERLMMVIYNQDGHGILLSVFPKKTPLRGW